MSTSDARQFRKRQDEHEAARILPAADISQTTINHRQHLIEQLRQEEASEDTEHVIDWLADAWTTLDMLTERFGEVRAWQLYTTAPSFVSAQQADNDRLPLTCLPMQHKSQQGASYADAT